MCNAWPASYLRPTTLQESVPASQIQQAVGPSTFQANDFVIFQKLGALNVRNVEAGSVGSAPVDTGAATRVNVFAATYESGKPFQGPVTVLLKEFLPGSRGVGLNELRLLSLLRVRPSSWQWQHFSLLRRSYASCEVCVCIISWHSAA